MYRQTDRQTDVIALCVVSVRLTQGCLNNLKLLQLECCIAGIVKGI